MKITLRTLIISTGLMLGTAGAWAASVTGVNANIDALGHTQISVQYSEGVSSPKIFTIPGDKPRVVIDSVSSDISSDFQKTIAAGVSGIRHAARGQGSRIVLDLAPGAKLLDYSHSGNLATISIKSGAISAPTPPAAPVTSTSRERAISVSGIAIPRLKPFGSSAAQYASAAVVQKRLIVIDAGHGGYDPGAIGAAGSKEKAVTLAAAKELQKQLVKTGRYNVYLTRTKDVYVDHYERVRRARVREADLFISLHADALESRKTRGASVYTLATYAQKRSTKLVDKQNFIVDVDLRETTDSVGDILVSLAQQKTFSNSHKFAEMLIPEIEKVAPILRNTHRQKGLAVLLAPDVPAVLLEMGYISNPTDEKALNSAKERGRKMKAVVKTIDSYFKG